MMEILTLLSAVCLLLGCICNLIAGIGILRFPDFYCRMHAAGITDGLGTALILFGLMLLTGWDTHLSKLVLILLFTLLTSPTVSYTLANAAIMSQTKASTASASSAKKKRN
jgi:multicomponent Na+:H+ antiporter subunit G